VILIALCCANAYATPIYTVIPGGGFVSGNPGSAVGWGFSIVNDSSFYLVVDGSAFCGQGSLGPAFSDCSSPYNPPFTFGPLLGTYTDFISAGLFKTVVAPNSTLVQAFDANLLQGVGQYLIDPSATIGQTDPANPLTQTSQLYISYFLNDVDPFLGGTPQTGDILLSASVGVQVIPEPATLGLIGGALLFFGLRRKFSRA
jgi:PEP-CTERM motif